MTIKKLALLPLLVLAACSTMSGQTDRSESVENMDDVKTIIVNKADLAVKAQQELAEATSESMQMKLKRQQAFEVDKVNLDYIGKPQPLLETIAVRYGYQYIETGKRVEVGIINLKVANKSVEEVMKDISYQIDKSADVVLDKNNSIIRLVYKKREG